MTDHRAETPYRKRWLLVNAARVALIRAYEELQPDEADYLQEKCETVFAELLLRPGEQIGGAGDTNDAVRIAACAAIHRMTEWDPRLWEVLLGDREPSRDLERALVKLRDALRVTVRRDGQDYEFVSTPPNAAPVPVPPTDAEREHLAEWCCEKAGFRSDGDAYCFVRIAVLLRGAQSPNTIPPQAEWGVRLATGAVTGPYLNREHAVKYAEHYFAHHGPYRLCRIIDEEPSSGETVHGELEREREELAKRMDDLALDHDIFDEDEVTAFARIAAILRPQTPPTA